MGLRSIEVGDTLLLPLSASGTLAVGQCIGGYEHLPEGAPARHTVRVEWGTDQISRAVLGQDLLSSLGSLLTVFQMSRHNAERFAQVLKTGVDPAASAGDSDDAPSSTAVTSAAGTLVDPEPVPTLESILTGSERISGRTFVSMT